LGFPDPVPIFPEDTMPENEPNAIALLAALGIQPVSGGAPEDNPAKEDERPLWVKMPDVYHAPGPWWWENHPDTDRTIALSAKGGDVLLATGDGETAWAVVSPANMRLIAAVTNLLAAARRARTALSDLNGRISRDVWNSLYETVEALDDAIANATGDPRP
jgi:hypothetical protein